MVVKLLNSVMLRETYHFKNMFINRGCVEKCIQSALSNTVMFIRLKTT